MDMVTGKEKIILNKEVLTVDSAKKNDSGFLIRFNDTTEYYVFANRELAGESAREYWVDMAHNDQKEFICIVGEKALIEWSLGNSYGPGSSWVNSLEEWFDLWLDTPEEHFANYDGHEIEGIQCNQFFLDLIETDNKNDIVMYRTN
jgi:hypothetical protein